MTENRHDGLLDAILNDSMLRERTFLPGGPFPNLEELETHLGLPILLGGLDREESWLVLSALPGGAQRIYLSPLDKGLSGAKVFTARFDVNDRRVGKTFILKIGPLNKIEQEVSAIETFVLPEIYGILKPVYRRGITKGLLVQEFVGLAAKSNVRSLREFVHEGNDPVPIINRLLRARLDNWYKPARAIKQQTWSFDGLFSWYLGKGAGADIIPENWGNIDNWLIELTGRNTSFIQNASKEIGAHEYTGMCGVVHGDLHCQNVLIDENNEPWPIDFAWCNGNSNVIIDVAMLECSLKYLVIPRRSDPHPLVALERKLSADATARITIGDQPYSKVIQNVANGIAEIRRFALGDMNIKFEDYLCANYLLAWALRGHSGLNQPFIYGSMAIIAQRIGY